MLKKCFKYASILTILRNTTDETDRALITLTVRTFRQNFAEWLHLCDGVLCEGVLQDRQDVAAGFYGDGF